MEDEKERKPVYEKPLFEKSEGMIFTEDIWEKFNHKKTSCIQCSGCHACSGH